MARRLMTTLRLATAGDIDEIVRVINRAYRVEDFFINGDRTTRGDIETRFADPDTSILVLDGAEPGKLAAAVCVDGHEDKGHFAMLAVDPAFQGKGIGHGMIKAIEDFCLAAGCRTLELEVVDLRQELPPFYEAFGFRADGTGEFTDPGKLSREAHLIRMTKRLTPG